MKVLPRRKIHSHALILSSIALILLTGNAWADDRANGRQGGPPQEAIEACVDQSSGTVVEFKSPRGNKVRGTCTSRNGQLVAVPEGRGQGRRGGML